MSDRMEIFRRFVANTFDGGPVPDAAALETVRQTVRQRLAAQAPGMDDTQLAVSLATLDRAIDEYLRQRRGEAPSAPETTEDEPPHDESPHAPPPPPSRAAERPTSRRRGWRWPAAMAAAAAAALAVAYMGMGCGGFLSGCADSGWLPASSRTSNILTFNHGLGAPPLRVHVQFSPTAEGAIVYPVTANWSSDTTGNPVTIAVDRESVRLHIWDGAPLRGVFNPQSGGWVRHQAGFFRIVAER